MTEIRFIYVTAPAGKEARKLAQKVVEERVAACANVLPQMESLYWWKGSFESSHESVIIFKTRRDKVDECMNVIKLWHPYTTPCIVVLPIEMGDADYLKWLAGEVKN